MKKTTIRRATEKDVPQIFDLIVELAIYEKAKHEVSTTPKQMIVDGFGENPAYGAIVAEQGDTIIGFSLFYIRYSTWKGRCLYLEDFLVNEEYRGEGIGKLLFEATILEAKRQNTNMMTWQVLDWNTPAINFYKRWDATLAEEWINCKFYQDYLDSYKVRFLDKLDQNKVLLD